MTKENLKLLLTARAQGPSTPEEERSDVGHCLWDLSQVRLACAAAV